MTLLHPPCAALLSSSFLAPKGAVPRLPAAAGAADPEAAAAWGQQAAQHGSKKGQALRGKQPSKHWQHAERARQHARTAALAELSTHRCSCSCCPRPLEEKGLGRGRCLEAAKAGSGLATPAPSAAPTSCCCPSRRPRPVPSCKRDLHVSLLVKRSPCSPSLCRELCDTSVHPPPICTTPAPGAPCACQPGLLRLGPVREGALVGRLRVAQLVRELSDALHLLLRILEQLLQPLWKWTSEGRQEGGESGHSKVSCQAMPPSQLLPLCSSTTQDQLKKAVSSVWGVDGSCRMRPMQRVQHYQSNARDTASPFAHATHRAPCSPLLIITCLPARKHLQPGGAMHTASAHEGSSPRPSPVQQ